MIHSLFTRGSIDMSIKFEAFPSAGGAGTDTLDDVTGRGSSTTNAITVGGVTIGTEYTLPAVDGSSNQYLKTDGSGNLSFASLDVTGGLEYKGEYTGQSLVTAEKGDFYIVSGSQTLAGVSLNSGDHIVFNTNASDPVLSTQFDVIDNTETTPTLDAVTTQGSSTTNDVTVGGLTVQGDISANSNLTRSIGDETNRFISYFGDVNGAIRFKAKNASGAQMTKGQVVTITGVSGTIPTVDLADANDSAKMPAFGLVYANANDNAEVQIVSFGNLENVNTGTFTAGDTLFVSTTAGALTATKPTGESSLLQNIGRVVRSDASAGVIIVGGAGRTAATPNLDQDKVFLGNASNQATPTALSSIALSSFNDDLSYLVPSNNLSDLNNVSTARTNLGLGTSATLDTGVANGNVIVADATGLPVIDGSQLTNVSATDSTKLAIANNLSDLASASTARTNLGLGTSATLDVGTTANDVVQLDASARLPAVDGSQLTNLPGASAASETVAGVIEIATDLEAQGATATDKALVPSNLSSIDLSSLNDDLSYLVPSNNLSDLASASTARTNLGLGTSSTLDVGTTANLVVQLDASARLPAVDGSQLTNISATDSTKLAIANNLSDLASASTARTNLGLGTSATLDVGTTANLVVQLDASARLPAVDGSQLTNISATDSTKLAIANNLSDLASASTARTNLGLGTSATLDVGTTANDVVQLDASARLPAVDGSQLTNLPSGGGYTVSNKTSADFTAVNNYFYYVNTASGTTTTVTLPARTYAATDERIKFFNHGNGTLRVQEVSGTSRIHPDESGSDPGGSGQSYKDIGSRSVIEFLGIPNTYQWEWAISAQLELGKDTLANDGDVLRYDSSSDQMTALPYTFPTSDGSANQILKTDGSGALSFIDQPGATSPTLTSASPSSNYTISTHSGTEEIFIPDTFGEYFGILTGGGYGRKRL